MKRLIIFIIISCCVSMVGIAQTVQGYIFDEQTQEPLIGATITYIVKGETKGTAADEKGFYSLEIPEGGITLIYTFIGYEEIQLPVVGSRRGVVTRDVYMKPSVNLLQDVVVSAGRFEQKLSEITVSMDVLKSASIDRQLPTDLGVVLNTLPGVDINDRQPSIRGGNGWTYGVGSRSLLLVDGMPVIGAGNGEISWNMIPMENIDQVEVIKGASSVLYGSSALNGLINVRTGRPGLVPKTNVKYYMGIYGDPSNKDYIWWDKDSWTEGKFPVKTPLRNSVYAGVRNPMYEGIDIAHTRRIGNFDISAGMNFLTDEGYKEQGYRKRFRLGGNVTYHQPSLNIISYGVNYNFMSDKYGDFLIWRSVKEAYQPSAFTNMGREGNTFHIDPFYNFTNVKNNTFHNVRGRFMYENTSVLHASNSKNLIQILGNMGTDVSAITDFDLNSLLPLIPPALEGNLNGAIDGLFNILGDIFPNATTGDYCDLIAWLMNNGIPSGTSDLAPWLSNTLYPKNEKTYVDKNYTYYLDYQFHKKFKEAQITTGATYHHVQNSSSVTGTHNSDNISVFFQYDHRFFDRLSLSLGVRGEYYRVDSLKKEAETKVFGAKVPFKPIFRGGLNYQLAEYSFIRASIGQGYRYPSLTEKYARRDVGGVGVYPNHNLKAETGYNAEIGFLQGYKIGKFQGFLDIAGFYTHYKNMIEFNMGFFNNTTFEPLNS
ncbi:MAG: TonB-dependent receptor, partial [Odoribacter sp.]|nr:TonB-dependent receptor [Odoribacter sp.]